MRKIQPLLPLLALASCYGDAPGEWTAIVYANASDHSKWLATPRFQSFHMCKRAAEESIAALPEPSKASYVCGFQCGPDLDAPNPAQCKMMRR